MSLKERSFEKWENDWIRLRWGDGAPLLRMDFDVCGAVRAATIHATALGVFELRLNGDSVDDIHLPPGWTDYRKRVYVHSFDVSDRIVPGKNVLGALVAPGWFAGFFGPFGDRGYYGHDAWFSCELVLEYEDGTFETIRTSPEWKGALGPISQADLLMGETYDSRKEISGWDTPDFDGSKWKPVSVLREGDERLPESIEPYPGEPIRTIAELPAQSVSEPSPGVFVFDLGQNMVGVARLKIDVPAGTEIVLRHGEMLNDDGSVYTENLRSAKAIDRYIASGGEEIWQPRFTFHGFRYVQVEGLPAGCDPALDTICGVVWMSGLKETASFECSSEKVNRLFSNIQWGFRGNYLDVPTDCPQRDERLGWTGDTQMFIRSATYLADVQSFFKKWLVDLHDAQHPDGGYPDVAPFMGRLGYASAAWADAGIICPYVLWQAYGDTEFIRPWWSQMKNFMALICTDENRHNGPNAQSFGDWLHFNSETPTRLIGLAYRAYDARLMSEMAAAIGEENDRIFFEAEAEKSRDLFRCEFFQGSEIAVKTQTACALAIAMDLLDGEDLEKTKDCLFQGLEEHNVYLTTGFVGTGYLCPALTKAGRCDLAVQLLLNEGHPSWLYEVNNGATTIWERWNSWTEEGGFGDVGMNSFNHYAFGAVCEWMFESLAGIRPASPGFQTLEIVPCFTDRLDYVKASYDSVQGRISNQWKKTSSGWTMELETPVPATVILPNGTSQVEKGRHIFEVPA
ncbi:alpha-L-rhamnosidase [Tichowtungia aerotolerans]|uniref:alpha-L-rhamnosidase n=1 Tax=Tichowtungia aerotolerans TaxID=2697043 RepID=A0A6P1MC54_9BACT|nr:alpha-L-rhamnosidase [Tichowtungia aerotolerans]QHI70683.1 family 78 glycoside hydrolase catalytic domain [Tichowtungia aerotolerans]